MLFDFKSGLTTFSVVKQSLHPIRGCLRACIHGNVRSPVPLFEPKYRLGHPEKYSDQLFSVSKYPKRCYLLSSSKAYIPFVAARALASTATCVHQCPVLPFQPKYRSGHPENYLFLLSRNLFSRSKYPKQYFI